MARIEPTPSKSEDWTLLSPYQCIQIIVLFSNTVDTKSKFVKDPKKTYRISYRTLHTITLLRKSLPIRVYRATQRTIRAQCSSYSETVLSRYPLSAPFSTLLCEEEIFNLSLTA